MARLRLPDAGTELGGWLRLAVELSDAADAIALSHFRRDLEIHTKPDRSLVTQADQEIEETLRRRIRATYPEHGLVGEEFGEDQGRANVRWYIDPIDATHNYLRGVPVFATLLAVEQDQELVLGVVSAPAMRNRWVAWRGGGAWAIDSGAVGAARQLQVSRVGKLADSQIVHSGTSAGGDIPGFRQTLDRAWRERAFGDFWGYMLVAEGSADAMVEAGMHSWDLAAPLVIVEESGGRLTNLDGIRTIHGAGALASNGLLHEALLNSLHEPA